MSKNKSRLQLAQTQAESAIEKTNRKISELGTHTSGLYDALNSIQKLFDDIRNVPNEKRLEYEKLKEIRLNWKQQAQKIETDYKNAVVKDAGKGAAGVSAGVAVTALAPAAAMGIATTFGVASTGTAISALSGAAATNAALAWLGGGALVAGGGGMAAGNALLALAGPVGWAIAGSSMLLSGLLLWKGRSDKARLENIFALVSRRDVKSYILSIVEINERICRIKDESQKLCSASERIGQFGLDYNLMTEDQQYELGSYVNLMNSSTRLLVNPILGLQPKFGMKDLENYMANSRQEIEEDQRPLIVSLSNLLYKVDFDEKDKKLLWRSLKENKEFLASMEISENDFEFSVIETVADALAYGDCQG